MVSITVLLRSGFGLVLFEITPITLSPRRASRRRQFRCPSPVQQGGLAAPLDPQRRCDPPAPLPVCARKRILSCSWGLLDHSHLVPRNAAQVGPARGPSLSIGASTSSTFSFSRLLAWVLRGPARKRSCRPAVWRSPSAGLGRLCRSVPVFCSGEPCNYRDSSEIPRSVDDLLQTRSRRSGRG